MSDIVIYNSSCQSVVSLGVHEAWRGDSQDYFCLPPINWTQKILQWIFLIFHKKCFSGKMV